MHNIFNVILLFFIFIDDNYLFNIIIEYLKNDVVFNDYEIYIIIERGINNIYEKLYY